MILEGFGNIVAAPIHEKLAVILADRRHLIEKLAQYTKSNGKDTSNTSMTSFDLNQSSKDTDTEIKNLLDKIDTLETEINILKEANMELSDEIQILNNDKGLSSGNNKRDIFI